MSGSATLTPARIEELDSNHKRCSTVSTYSGGPQEVVIHYGIKAEVLSELLVAADENARLRELLWHSREYVNDYEDHYPATAATALVARIDAALASPTAKAGE